MNINPLKWFSPSKKIKNYQFEFSKLEHVITDTNNNRWYCYKNMLEAPMVRLFALQDVQDFLDIGLTRTRLLDITGEMDKLLDQGKSNDFIYLWKTLLANINMAVHKDCLTECCAIYYLIEGEKLIFDNGKEYYDHAYTKKKIDLLNADQKLQNFFFQDFLKKSATFTEESVETTLSYLKASQKQNEAFNKIYSKYLVK